MDVDDVTLGFVKEAQIQHAGTDVDDVTLGFVKEAQIQHAGTGGNTEQNAVKVANSVKDKIQLHQARLEEAEQTEVTPFGRKKKHWKGGESGGSEPVVEKE